MQTIIHLFVGNVMSSRQRMSNTFFVLSSRLMFFSVSVSITVTQSFYVWVVLDDSPCVTSETTASDGLSDVTKVTVMLSFPFSFSKVEKSQSL